MEAQKFLVVNRNYCFGETVTLESGCCSIMRAKSISVPNLLGSLSTFFEFKHGKIKQFILLTIVFEISMP